MIHWKRLAAAGWLLLVIALVGCGASAASTESPLEVNPTAPSSQEAPLPSATVMILQAVTPSPEPAPTVTFISTVEPPKEASAFPHARAGHNLVYDTSRQQVLLLNGQGGADVKEEELSGLWAWDGSRWVLLDGSAEPRPRILAGTAYDAGRQRLVLYGGATPGDFTQMDDTWEWDGSVWRQVDAAGPGARDHTVMVYDKAREEIILYGGTRVGEGDLGDTWSYDGEQWELVATDGPGPRNHHTMAYDTAREQVLLFGGGPGPLGDTWAWDGSEWRKVTESGPDPRSGARMVYDAAREVIVLTGGQAPNGDSYDDTWIWDGTAWTEHPSPGPGPRDLHDMAYDAARGRVILFGGSIWNGQAPEYFGDTWEWDGSSWREMNPAREN